MGVPAYVASPVRVADRPGPWAGVVLVHDALGLGDDMREQADWLAAAGYVTVIPDLYGARARCAASRARSLSCPPSAGRCSTSSTRPGSGWRSSPTAPGRSA